MREGGGGGSVVAEQSEQPEPHERTTSKKPASPERSTTGLRQTGKCAAAASSSALKGERLRFRVVEKPGQIVGLSEPFQQPTVYPFRVMALKTSQLVYIQRQDIADVLSVFHGGDAGACAARTVTPIPTRTIVPLPTP